MVIIRRRDAKRWKNDYLVKGVSLPPLAYNVLGLGEEAVNECSKELQMFKLNTNVQ